LQAFAPAAQDIENATNIVALGAGCAWAPASFNGQLHDRASYRYYYQLLERAHRTGVALSNQALTWFDHPEQPAKLR
jgi:citrate lyase subunit beta / citryl-CoA lyase